MGIVINRIHRLIGCDTFEFYKSFSRKIVKLRWRKSFPFFKETLKTLLASLAFMHQWFVQDWISHRKAPKNYFRQRLNFERKHFHHRSIDHPQFFLVYFCCTWCFSTKNWKTASFQVYGILTAFPLYKLLTQSGSFQEINNKSICKINFLIMHSDWKSLKISYLSIMRAKRA